jgi:guanylate cyclase
LDLGALPSDRPEERALKQLQVAMALASVLMVGGWGASFLLIGRSDAAMLPPGYCVATLLLLVYLRLTRHYAFFRWSHTLLVMTGPFALHWYLGGFAASGGAILWAFIAPVAAMMFVGRRQSLVWVLCIVVMLGAGLWRERVGDGSNALTPAQASGYFAFNATGMLFFLYFSMSYFTGRIQQEQARADRLLLNILPAPIVERLKRRPGIIAQRFEGVTVVFGDLVGFDALADRFGLEKIKTIGDAYMVVAGAPVSTSDHAARAARMALAMRDAIGALAKERSLELNIRIGIHTGDCVAGVIGQRKFSYDLWGDTVNTASRMESHGEPGRIHASAAARAAFGDAFACTSRGRVMVKGKGEMETFWLDGVRES